ncbi:MAG: stage II sporulation protein P [Lachnospiraceae bacterium]|nr:stage II sporulation protein P [Lachnospiraceae bacterium]
MRKNSRLQKLLYGIMAILGAYIMYKSGALLAAHHQMKKALEAGNVQQSVEDSAMRTWSLGYTAVLEGKTASNWFTAWFQQAVPVLSYLVDQAGEETEDEGETIAGSESIEESNGSMESTEESNGSMESTLAEFADETERESESRNAIEELENEDENMIAEHKSVDGGINTEHESETEHESANVAYENETEGAQSELSEMQIEGVQSELNEMQTEGVQNESNETQTEELQNVSNETQTEDEPSQEVSVNSIFSQVLPQLSDYSYLLANYYTVDADTSADAELLNAENLLSIDLSIEQDASVPQILIYHTHSQEAFADSREGEVSDTVVGMGEILAEELRDYGYNVIHVTGEYDLVDGVLDRSAAYDYAREAVEEILEEYPTIEVVIDLHRDGVEGSEEDFVTEIDGKVTSKIMFFNGLSRDADGETLSWLPNGYLTENLAFSLQLQVLSNAEYPGFTRKIYLQAERYNLHLRARSLLIEAGTQLNTVEEEQNAMVLIANLLRQILS